jgi:hypothetical protein
MRLVTLALLAVSTGFAAAPDLGGTWKFNAAKSDYGQFPAPSSMTLKITHAEPKLTVAINMAGDMGDIAFTTNYTTDGAECTNQGFGGSEIKSVVKWDGETLLMDTKGTFGDNAYTMKDKWNLSEGGKILTILRRVSSGMGDTDQRIVLEKQ